MPRGRLQKNNARGAVRYRETLYDVEAERDRLLHRVETLEAALQAIRDHYDARSELYTNDADLAAAMAKMAHSVEPR